MSRIIHPRFLEEFKISIIKEQIQRNVKEIPENLIETIVESIISSRIFIFIFGLILILLLILASFILLRNYESKNRQRQLKIVKVLIKASSTVEKKSTLNWEILNKLSITLLNYLNTGIHRKLPRIFRRKSGPKSISIFVPNKEKKIFNLIYHYGDHSEEYMKEYHPTFFYEEEWDKLINDWISKPVKERKNEWKNYKIKKTKVISMTGYLFRFPEIITVNNVHRCIPWDENYLECFPAHYKKSYRIRSFIASTLIIQNEKVGVFFVENTLKYSFFPSDEDLIAMISPIVAKHIYNIREYEIPRS